MNRSINLLLNAGVPGMDNRNTWITALMYQCQAHCGNLARLLALSIVFAVILTGTRLSNASAMQPAACTTNNRPSYSVTVCLVSPATNTTIVGDSTVAATVTFTGTSPGVRRLVFYLDDAYLLTSFGLPFSFQLPSTRWVDGAHTLAVEALLRDDFVTGRAPVNLVFANGVTQPPINTNTFAPTSGLDELERPLIVAAVGDGADGLSDADAVADTIATANPDMFLYVGDMYEKGSVAEFYNWYGVQGAHFGRFRDITNPAVGNHEYEDGVAPGYFDYWDNVPDYYSYNAGGWHFISLNSNSQFDEYLPGTPQYAWLEQDLTANASVCTIAYFHHPVVSIGPQGDTTAMHDLWTLMTQRGVDLAISGHDHDYQRWMALDQNGSPSSNGTVQFVAGTGGHGIQDFVRTDPRVLAAFGTPSYSFGTLRFELNPKGVAFQFINTTGLVLDSGVLPCTGAAPDVSAPTVPQNLTAFINSAGHPELAWTPAVDDTGVAAYSIYRDGSLLTIIDGHNQSFIDHSVAFNTSYVYRVAAADPAGNTSGQSNAAGATTPNTGTLELNPIEDTYVNSDSPTSNYGASIALRADAAPIVNSYLRFNVQGIIGHISRVTLHLYANSGSSAGYGVHQLSSNNWSEMRTTYVDAPALGAEIGLSGAVTANTWTSVELTSYITENGILELSIDTPSTTALNLASRENPGKAPFLAIEMISDPPSPPTAPENLVATAISASQVDLSWLPSQDESGIASYQVYRAEALLSNVDGNTLTFSDFTAQAGRVYVYTVVAIDGTGVASAPSAPASVTVPSIGVIYMAPIADAYVNAANPANNYGTSTTLRVDASPDIRSYLRFDLSSISGYISSALLHVYANSGSSAGYDVHGVADNSWSETSITYSNAPPPAAAVGASGPFPAEDWTAVEVSPLIDGNGLWSIALTGINPTGVSLASRESTFSPWLELAVASSPPPPTPSPTPEPSPTPTPEPTPGSLMFVPASDAYVNSSKPDNNYGSSASLRVDASPDTRSYLRFNIQGTVGTVTSAILRVFADSGSSTGYEVRGVSDNSWTELAITFNTAPVLGSVVGATDRFESGTWTSIDVTSLVAGDGVVNLALTGASNTGIALDSREGTYPPELLVTTSSGSLVAVAGTHASVAMPSVVLADNDHDALPAEDEAVNHTSDNSADTDGDTLPDLWEVENGTLPTVADADADPDGDQASNLLEFEAETDPHDDQSRPAILADHVTFLPMISAK